MLMKRILTFVALTLGFGTVSWAESAWPTGITWETMQIAAAGYYISTDGTESKLELTSMTTSLEDTDLWYRAQNEDGSYCLYNKAAGPDMVLAASTVMTGKDGGSTFPRMVNKDNVPEGYVAEWTLTAAGNLNPEDGEECYVFEKGTTYALNNRDNVLAFWSTSQDGGSSVVFRWAAKDFDVNSDTGTWTATNASGTWASAWDSTDNDPCGVQVTAGANNMTYTGKDITGYGGTANNSGYSFKTTDAKYVVAGFSFDLTFVDGASSLMTLTLADGTEVKPSVEAQHVSVDGLKDQTYTMTLSGANKGVTFGNLRINVKRSLEEPEWQFNVFETRTTSDIPYRIPAITTTKNGIVVAIADYRFSRADIGSGRIDLHIRTSADNGQNWGDIIKPKEMEGDGNTTAGHQEAGFGDPCIVADRESNAIMVTSCSGTPGFFSGTRNHHQGWARWYSYDDGKTWTEPEYIDEEFIYAPFDNSEYGAVKGWFVGSGKIHQSRYTKLGEYYRLYCAGSTYNGSQTANWVLYSDDFGKTWSFLGGCDASPIPGGDEPKVEELPNGNLVLSSRCTEGRKFNIFSFTDAEKAEGEWGTYALSSKANNGVTANNGCNGEIQMVPVVRLADGQKTWLALQSLPRGGGRTNVSIFYKDLTETSAYNTPANFARDWDGYRTVSKIGSAYSTMTVQADKSIGFIYEEETFCGTGGGGYTIAYKNYTIEDITDGLYTYDLEYDPATTVIPLTAVKTSADAQSMTVTFNKSVTPYSEAEVAISLGNGVEAFVNCEEKTATLTYVYPLTAGKYELTLPAGTVVDADGQLNEAVPYTFRVLPEDILPLGETVTTLADVREDKTYILYNDHFKAKGIYAPQYDDNMLWTGEMTGDATHELSNTAYAEEVNPADPNNSWMLVSLDGEYYLYNVGAEKCLVVGTNSGTRYCTFATNSPVQIQEISGGFAFSTSGGSYDWLCASPQLAYPVSVWTSSDAGSCWQLIENPNVEADLEFAQHVIVGISESKVGAGQAGQTVYSLDGRRFEAIPSRRGIYVVNGRKMVRF